MGVDAQMVVKNPKPLTARDVRQLSVDLVEAFGTDTLMVLPPWDRPLGDPRHALEIVKKYLQDGDDIKAEKGWQLIEVHLWGRVYVKGYERGHWPTYDNIAAWLMARMPAGSEVWYGGDSSGICAEKLTPAYRAELWAHFIQHGNRPYTGYFNRGETDARACEFCADRPMDHYGFGGNGLYAAWRCSGCGLHEVTRDGGATWKRGTYKQVQEDRATV